MILNQSQTAFGSTSAEAGQPEARGEAVENKRLQQINSLEGEQVNDRIDSRTLARPSGLRHLLSQLTRVARRLIRTRFEYETMRTWYLDLKFGGNCGGEKDSPFTANGAVCTQSAEYSTLDVLFRKRAKLNIDPSDVLVDVGCGKGRVINYWLMRGCRNRIIGVELDPEVAGHTRRRLRRFPNVTVITGDINENIPDDATIFWLFNPFNERIMSTFKRRMEQVFLNRRKVTILYYNCHQLPLFREDSNWTVTDLGTVNNLPAALITLTALANTFL